MTTTLKFYSWQIALIYFSIFPDIPFYCPVQIMQHLKYAVGLTLRKLFPFFLINIPDFERTLLSVSSTMKFV